MKRIHKNKQVSFKLNLLALSVCVLSAQSVSAMQSLDEQELRNVNGQDGIHIETSLSAANIDTLYWTDQVGRATTTATDQQYLTATADNVSLLKSNVATSPLTSDLKLNMGTVNGKPQLNLDYSLSPMLMTVDSFRICDNAPAGRNCSAKVGSLAVQTTSNLVMGLKTKNGLFSSTDQTFMNLGIQNANIYLGQTSVTNQLNQLVLKNFNFNFAGNGFVFIDKTNGLILQTNSGTSVADTNRTPDSTYGYVDLNRVKDSASSNVGFKNTGTYGDGSSSTTNAGLNLEIMVNKGVDSTNSYKLDPITNTPSGAKGLIRVGASGRMINSSLQFRGIQNANGKLGSAVNSGGTTVSNDIVGNSGLGFRMKTEFTKDGDTMLSGGGQATTLEIGGAGLNTYGFEFGNLTGLNKANRASFDTGDVYINLTDSKQVTLPSENSVFLTSRFGNGSTLTTLDDYNQKIYTTLPTNLSTNSPYSLLTSIRGAEFQAISRRGRFTSSASTAIAGYPNASNKVNDGINNQWGLALPFYNLNANMAMFGTNVDVANSYYYLADGTKYYTDGTAYVGGAAPSGKLTPRLGFSLGMSTQGISTDGSKTTSIMVIDGSKDYYMGLRNIDMLLKGNGSIGLENGSVNLSLKDMLVVMAAQLAAGYLPDPLKNNLNNFATNSDVLMGLKLRFGGDMNFSLIPNSEMKFDATGNNTGNSMLIVGDLKLADANNTIQISDPVDGSIVGLDNISGSLAFNNAIVISKNANNDGVVGFNTTLNFNPSGTQNDVFRVKDLNLYPANGAAQRLGEVAFTGGSLSSQFKITPRN